MFSGFLLGAMRARWLTIGVTLGLRRCRSSRCSSCRGSSFPPPTAPSSRRSDAAAERLDLRQRDRRKAGSTRCCKGDPDVARWSTYVGRGAIRFYLPLDVQLPNDFFAQAVIVAKDVAARERLQAKLEKALAERFPSVVVAISPLELGPPVGWPVQYRVSGPDKDEVREIALRLARSSAANPHTKRVNFDWIEPAREVRVRIDQDQARLLGLSSRTHRRRDQHRDLRHARSRRCATTSISSTSLRAPRRSRSVACDVAHPAGAAAERANGAAQPVRDLRVRAGISADLAPRPRADADRAGRCAAGGPAGRVVAALAPGDRRTRRGAAEGLPDRCGRDRRGEREVAGLGHRRGPVDAAADGHLPDVPAAELPAAVPGAVRRCRSA